MHSHHHGYTYGGGDGGGGSGGGASGGGDCLRLLISRKPCSLRRKEPTVNSL